MNQQSRNPQQQQDEQKRNDMNKQQDFWIRQGVMREKVDLTPFVDHSYVDYANAVLGPR